MAQLSQQDTSIIPGLEPSFSAASSGGDSVPNTGTVLVIAKNTNASDETISFDATTTKFGNDVDPDAQTVPANSRKIFGPFSRDDFGSSLSWTYSDNSAFEVAAVRVASVRP